MIAAWLMLALTGLVLAAPVASALPAPVLAALQQAGVPPAAMSVVVADAEPGAPLRLAHQAQVLRNPASVFKLVTTAAALDLLGPAYRWRTAIWLDGSVHRDAQGVGVLDGNLVVQGRGDPKLVVERLWLLLRRLRALGVTHITGDLVLDRSAFAPPERAADAFDGEPLRPYNVLPDALLVNFKARVWQFVPDLAQGVAHVHLEPPLAGLRWQPELPLGTSGADCGDWRAGVRLQSDADSGVRWLGVYPADCGAQQWALADPQPQTHAARAIRGVWAELGGRIDGVDRDGATPPTPPTLLDWSPPLGDLVRDINKFSNNLMAEQLFLTLALQAPSASAVASVEAARQRVQAWWVQRGLVEADIVLDNGSGLSREGRISALALARLMQDAAAAPWGAEWQASLPLSGLDGTLRRSTLPVGVARLKTGSLRDVVALAGWVHRADGRSRVVVAIVNHAHAAAARAALDAVVIWALTS